MGHPASRPDLVKDFDDLLAGNMPSGLGGAAAGGGDGAAGSISGMSDSEANPAIAKFLEDTKKLREEHGAKFKGLPRAFLVLVDEAKLDLGEKCFKHNMTCHTVIMGGD